MGNSAADRIPSDADVVVCQSVLAERIAAAAKGAELIVIDNFLSDPGLDALFVRLAETTPSCGVSGSRSAQSALSCDQSGLRDAAADSDPKPEETAFAPKDAAPDGAILQPGNIRIGLPAEPKEEAIPGGRGELLVAADMPGRSMSMQCCAAKSWRRPVWGWGLRFRTEPPMPRSAYCAPAS